MYVKNSNYIKRASELHKQSIVIDGLEYVHARRDNSEYIKYFNELIESGITACNITITPEGTTPLQAIKDIGYWLGLVEKFSEKVLLVTSSKDIEKAKEQNKFGLIMGSQNANILDDTIDLLIVYKKLGLRIIQLSYYEQNLLGEGCGERTNSGLSNFGLKVVEEMNRLNMLIDVSHCGDKVTMDAIKYSKYPLIVSHACARGLVDHIRNKTDEQIRALAEKGGVIGLTPYCVMCMSKKSNCPVLDDFLNMVDYVVKLVGVNYVGIGLDLAPLQKREQYEEWAKKNPRISFWGKPQYLSFEKKHMFSNERDGHMEVSKIIEITKGLLKRGYSDQEVNKILGLNLFRVFKEVCG